MLSHWPMLLAHFCLLLFFFISFSLWAYIEGLEPSD